MGFSSGIGLSSISGGSDVVLNNPATSDVLSYDATISKWKNAALVTPAPLATKSFKTPFEFGAVGDGIADDTSAVQAAVNAVDSTLGGVVQLGNHKITSPINIAGKYRLTIRGGSLIGNGITCINTTRLDQFFTLRDIVIDLGSTVTSGVYGLYLGRVRHGTVDNVTFNNPDQAVRIADIATHQHVARMDFSHCRITGATIGFRSVYNASITQSNGNPGYGVGDFNISDCWGFACQTFISMASVDGAIIKGNHSFQAESTTRQHAIAMDYLNFVTITANHIFEPGLNGLNLSRYTNLVVTDNSIAWVGQLDMASAIYLHGGDRSGVSNSTGIVSGNSIQWPTKHGIEIEAPNDDTVIGLNSIMGAGNASQYDPAGTTGGYASAALYFASIPHYDILTPAGSRSIVVGNESKDGINSLSNQGVVSSNIDQNGLVQEFVKTQVVTTADAYSGHTIRTDQGVKKANCNHNAATAVNDIKDGQSSGQKLTIIAINGSFTTITASPRVNLKGGVDAVMPATTDFWASMTLEWVSARWVETGRNF